MTDILYSANKKMKMRILSLLNSVIHTEEEKSGELRYSLVVPLKWQYSTIIIFRQVLLLLPPSYLLFFTLLLIP